MSRLRLFKVVGCFLLTFALGAVGGWLLKPAAPPVSAETRGIPPARRVMENLDERLKFTPEQKAKLQPIFEEWGSQMETVLRRPRRRRELFEQYAPRVREALTAEQQVEYDKMVVEIRQRFARRGQ
jgi:hypothetical protein